MTAPLVSVVTPTWGRRETLLARCIPSVAGQTHTNVQHVVVSDGPDEELAAVMPAGVTFHELAEHDPATRWGHWARLDGIARGDGDLIAYLDDDNSFRPRHLELLVAALEESGADFAYSRMQVHGHHDHLVGSPPPEYGQIDTSLIMHRRALLESGTWHQSLPTIDWDLVSRWLAAGATWTWVDETTVDYFAR